MSRLLATLPLAAQFIATMLTSIPAALLMERIGRKPGFMLATLLGLTMQTEKAGNILRADCQALICSSNRI